MPLSKQGLPVNAIPEGMRARFSGPLGHFARRALWSADLQHRVGPVDLNQLPEIGPGTPQFSAAAIRTGLQSDPEFSRLPGIAMASVEAGILLICDHLDESHQVSQTLEGKGQPRTADYWHGIMHRREPDLGNAAYWFRRVGKHPACDSLSPLLVDCSDAFDLSAAELQLAQSTVKNRGAWDFAAMIELCRTAIEQPGGPEDRAARVVQYLEMLNLLDHTLRTA